MSTAAPTKQKVTGPNNTGAYQVARPLGRCAVTDQPIEIGQKFMAALRETAAGFERVDVSLGAWANFDRKDVIGFWQTTMPKGEAKKKVFVDDQDNVFFSVPYCLFRIDGGSWVVPPELPARRDEFGGASGLLTVR